MYIALYHRRNRRLLYNCSFSKVHRISIGNSVVPLMRIRYQIRMSASSSWTDPRWCCWGWNIPFQRTLVSLLNNEIRTPKRSISFFTVSSNENSRGNLVQAHCMTLLSCNSNPMTELLENDLCATNNLRFRDSFVTYVLHGLNPLDYCLCNRRQSLSNQPFSEKRNFSLRRNFISNKQKKKHITDKYILPMYV